MFFSEQIPWGGWKKFALAAAISLIILIPTIVLGMFYYRRIDATLTNIVDVQRNELANITSAAIQLKMSKLIAIDGIYATQPIVVRDVAVGNWQGAQQEIINLQSNPGNYNYYIGRFLLLDTHGNVEVAFPGIASTGIGKPDDAFNEMEGPILEQGADVFVSNVVQRQVFPNTNHIEILVPIRNASVLVGVAEITIPINEFSDLAASVDSGVNGIIYIVDGNGNIIFHPSYPADGPIVNYSTSPAVQAVVNGQQGVGVFYDPLTASEVLTAYDPVSPFGWGVLAQQPIKDAFASRDSILWNVIEVVIAIVVLELILISVIFLFIIKKRK